MSLNGAFEFIDSIHAQDCGSDSLFDGLARTRVGVCQQHNQRSRFDFCCVLFVVWWRSFARRLAAFELLFPFFSSSKAFCFFHLRRCAWSASCSSLCGLTRSHHDLLVHCPVFSAASINANNFATRQLAFTKTHDTLAKALAEA